MSFTVLSTQTSMILGRANGLTWDAVLSCQVLGVYKTNPQAYLRAAKALGAEPSAITMVDFHDFDLTVARDCGFSTAFVARPNEWGGENPTSGGRGYDHYAVSITDLADQLDG